MVEKHKQGILDRIKAAVSKDKSVRLVANDPTLTAELLLLFRTILADGEVKQSELQMLKHICENELGIAGRSLDDVYAYLEDISYETSADQAAEMFQALDESRRKELLDHMIAIAEADQLIVENEVRLLDRTAQILGFDLKTAK